MSLLDSDGPCYDPDLYASLGDDARKAARENAVTPAYEGEVGQDDGTNDDYFQRPCTCTLACVGARWLTEDYYCREQRSCEDAPIIDSPPRDWSLTAPNKRCRCQDISFPVQFCPMHADMFEGR